MRNLPMLGGEGHRSPSPGKKPSFRDLTNRDRQSVIGYPGGKYHLLELLVPLIETVAKQFDLDVYAELCAGAGRVMLNLDKSLFEHRVWSDLDYPLLCLFYCLSDEEYTRQLMHRLTRLDCRYHVFKEAVAARKHDNDLAEMGIFHEDYVSAAVNTYIASKLSYAGGMTSYTPVRNIDDYYAGIRSLSKFTPILKGVDFFRKDFRDFLREIESGEAGYDPNRTLCYIDCPYPPCSMKSTNHYRFSLTDEDHIDIVDQIKDTQMHLIVSTYECWMYDVLVEYYGWDKIFLKRKHISMAGRGGDDYYQDEYIYTSFELSPELRLLIPSGVDRP